MLLQQQQQQQQQLTLRQLRKLFEAEVTQLHAGTFHTRVYRILRFLQKGAIRVVYELVIEHNQFSFEVYFIFSSSDKTILPPAVIYPACSGQQLDFQGKASQLRKACADVAVVVQHHSSTVYTRDAPSVLPMQVRQRVLETAAAGPTLELLVAKTVVG